MKTGNGNSPVIDDPQAESNLVSRFYRFESRRKFKERPDGSVGEFDVCVGIGVPLGTGVDVFSMGVAVPSSVADIVPVEEGVLESSGVGVSVLVGKTVGVISC